MKIIIFIAFSILFFNCQNSEKENGFKKIIYEVKPAIQDTIEKAIIHRNKIYEKTEIKLLFFMSFAESKNKEDHIIILDYCSSTEKEKRLGKDGCIKYRNILENTNRFLKLNKRLIPIIFNSDLYFTESKEHLTDKLGGTIVFILDRNGDLKETGITM